MPTYISKRRSIENNNRTFTTTRKILINVQFQKSIKMCTANPKHLRTKSRKVNSVFYDSQSFPTNSIINIGVRLIANPYSEFEPLKSLTESQIASELVNEIHLHLSMIVLMMMKLRTDPISGPTQKRSTPQQKEQRQIVAEKARKIQKIQHVRRPRCCTIRRHFHRDVSNTIADANGMEKTHK